MSITVETPISQALSEGTLSRRELKELMHRSNRPAALRLILWLCLLGITGLMINLAANSWLLLPAMFVHGVVLVHHFSLQHECCHYTAFKTRWLNDLVGNLCALVIMLPHRFFRYEHCDHHTYTQIRGRDTEMIELPNNFAGYCWYISSIPYWKTKLSELWRHALGHLSVQDRRFVPREEHATIVTEARLMILFYGLLASVCILHGFSEPLWYWLIPVILGEPVMRAIRMTEHVGRPAVSDMKTNTRSNLVALPWRFLCWNMNYHAEHHYAASVPFHALPRLSEKLDGYIHTEKGGYLGAHKDILAQLRKRSLGSEQV